MLKYIDTLRDVRLGVGKQTVKVSAVSAQPAGSSSRQQQPAAAAAAESSNSSQQAAGSRQ